MSTYKDWRKIAVTKVPMIAPILFACSYREENDPAKWPPETAGGSMMVNPDTLEITYSPSFTEKNTTEQNAFVLAHEGLHVLCRHVERRFDMHKKEGSSFRADLFTIAAEIATNALCESLTGWTTPANGVKPPTEYRNMSTEEIYQELKKRAAPIKRVPCCEHPAANGNSSTAAELLKQQALDAATKEAEKLASSLTPGNTPGELREISLRMQKLNKPPDFRNLLRRFMIATDFRAKEFDAGTIYRRRTDNLCLPNLSSEPVAKKFVLSIDNSGSVSDEMFSTLKGVMHAVAQQLGFQEIVVQHFTTQVMHTERLHTLTDLQKISRKSNGGTALEDCDAKAARERAQFHVILTDGYVDWLPKYSLPTVIVRTVADTEAPRKVHNLVGELIAV